MGIFDEFKRLAHPYEDEDEDDFEDDFDVSPRPVDRRDRDRSDRGGFRGNRGGFRSDRGERWGDRPRRDDRKKRF